MYYDGAASFRLRVQLLDRVRPSDGGALAHYAPSANFAQTFAKGWGGGPARQPAAPISSMLGHPGVMDTVFRLAPAPAVARAALVCWEWRRAIVQHAELGARIAERREESRRAARRSWDGGSRSDSEETGMSAGLSDDGWAPRSGGGYYHSPRSGYGSY